MSQYRSGLIYGLASYLVWGAVPLYFVQVKGVEPLEILAHRIGWSMPIMLSLAVMTPGGLTTLGNVLKSRRLVLTLLLSSVLLSGNWLLYIYATVSGQVVQASLGYFMLPVVNAVLAVAFLGEKLRPAHYPALALILAGVAVPLVAKGEVPWLPVVIPVTFGLYGLVRKKVPVDGPTGLTVETLLLAAPCAGYIAFKGWAGGGAFAADGRLTFWLMFGGVVTVVPLLLYTLSIRRLPLLTQSFIQFISPALQLLVAVVWLKEEVGWDRWVTLGCVLAATAVFIADAAVRTRNAYRTRAATIAKQEADKSANRDREGAATSGERSP